MRRVRATSLPKHTAAWRADGACCRHAGAHARADVYLTDVYHIHCPHICVGPCMSTRACHGPCLCVACVRAHAHAHAHAQLNNRALASAGSHGFQPVPVPFARTE
eukprot:313588-Chlamydomonas_euryale.AAC.1